MKYSLLLLMTFLLCSVRLTSQSVWKESVIPASNVSTTLVTTIDALGKIHVTNGSWYSTNDSGHFSWPVYISAAVQCDLAADSIGNVYFVGVQAVTPDCMVFTSGMKRLREPAVPIDINCTADEGATSPTLASEPDGTLHLAYVAGGGVYYRSRDTHGVWTSPILISGSTTDCAVPSIGVARDGEVHVTFISYISLNGPVTVIHTSGRNGSFSTPEILRRDAINLNNYGAPLVIDSHGHCHIFNAMNWASPVVVHTEYINANWSIPDTVLVIQPATEILRNIQVSIASNDMMQVTVVFWDRLLDTTGTTLNQNINYVTGTSGKWCRRRSVPAETSARSFTGWNMFGARYMEVRDSLMAIAHLYWTGSSWEIAVTTTTLPVAPYLLDLPDTVDLGNVRVRRCIDTTLQLISSGSPSHVPLQITSQLIPVNSDGAITVEAGDAITLADHERRSFDIGFCPTDTGRFVAHLQFDDGYCTSPIMITGYGYSPAPHIWLDTAATRVGERTTLTCRIEPPLEAIDGISTYRLALRFNPDALFPRSVSVPIAGTTASTSYDMDGYMAIQGLAATGNVIEGNALAQIEFEGLLTGESLNRIEIDQAEFSEAIAGYTVADGVVFLEGCEIGNAPKLGRRAKITAVQPTAEGIQLRYRSPVGITSRVRLLNLPGVCVQAVDLPVGTGEEQEVTVPLRGVCPGTYIVELICGGEHSATIIMMGL